MPLSLSKKSSLIAQSEIRSMTLECARVGGINLAQGVRDKEVPLPVRSGAHEAIARKMLEYTGFPRLRP
ncbi:MAG TPA: hypothetical protein DDX84_06295 [Nitrospiraceae bacterium]|nr:hypothetical protein [Nitrospiraceae bacterium]